MPSTLSLPKVGGSSVGDTGGWMAFSVFFVVELALVVLIGTFSFAQQGLGVDPTGRSGDRPFPARPGVGEMEKIEPTDGFKQKLFELEDKEPLTAPPASVLPPLPGMKSHELPLQRAFVRQIKITGNTAFTAEELAEVTALYENRELTAEDLEELRRALSRYYIERGYMNSGAVIPDQAMVDGSITLHIVEGELAAINVQGTKRLRKSFIKDRLSLGTRPPLNVIPLQQQLQLLQQDLRIKRVNAELKPGLRPGESLLDVDVEENAPFRLSFFFDNYQPPSVGSERGRVMAEHQNLTGYGDILSLTYGRSEGLNPQIDGWYSLPITARDSSLTLRYRKNDFTVGEKPFGPLDAESESDIYEITLRHPVYRTLNHEFALALTGEHLDNETFLVGEPFSFTLGAKHGESTVTALRFSQEWTYSTLRQVFAARSRFSVGVDVLGATTNNSSLPDGRFLSWLGQFQWAKVLPLLDTQMIVRADIQLANESLLPLEQIAVGGRYSVRGYRENQMVRDNGLIASLEFRFPVVRDKPWADFIHLTPFLDFGRAWNKDISTPDPEDIGSAGLGLRWGCTIHSPLRLKPQFEIFWGVPFRNIDANGWDLQDDGIHMQFTLEAF